MLGVEAEDVDTLDEMNKNINLKRSYEEVFRHIHNHGIAIHGFFIYGLDADSPEKLHHRTEYISRCNVDSMGTSILCPFPGTKLFNKIREENRLRYTNFPADWVRYQFTEIAYKPLLMEVHDLEDIMAKTYHRLYNYRSISWRFFKTCYVTRRLLPAIFACKMSIRFHRLIESTHKYKTY